MNTRNTLGIATVALMLWAGPHVAVGQSRTVGDNHHPSSSTIWSGVYTPDEADRGKTTGAKLCASCHGPELKGTDKAPRLTGQPFFDKWSELRLADVVAYIQNAMPRTHAFFVGPDDTRDIIAYMLRESGVPAGHQPISKDMNVLNDIFITRFEGSR